MGSIYVSGRVHGIPRYSVLTVVYFHFGNNQQPAEIM